MNSTANRVIFTLWSYMSFFYGFQAFREIKNSSVFTVVGAGHARDCGKIAGMTRSYDANWNKDGL